MEGGRERRQPPFRRSQRDRRQEAEGRILDAAANLIAMGSLESWTLADAGEAAGYSRGLPAHYFGGKDQLVAAVAGHIVRSFTRRLARRGPEAPGLARLIGMVRGYLEQAASSPVQTRAFNAVLVGALEKPALAPVVARLNASAMTSLRADIRAAAARRGDRTSPDVDATAALILASLRGVVACWLLTPAAIDLEAVGDKLVAGLTARFGE